jgi:hypothetical protein
MRFISILIGAVILVGALHTRRAEACGSGGPPGDLVAAAVIVGGTYLGTTATFAIRDSVSSDHSMGYGAAETAINAPLTLLFGGAMIQEINRPYTETGPVTTLAVLTAVHGALAAHGIYTIVKRSGNRGEQAPYRYDGPGAMHVGRVSAVVAPAPVANGGGIGLSGTF